MKKIEEYVRSIPDFPEPGIIFRDITSVLNDADGLQLAIDSMDDLLKGTDFDVVVGTESRGFIFGVPIAYKEKKPFVPVRKKGKLFECPTETSFSPLSVTQVKSFCERYGVVDRGRFGVYCPSLSDNPQHLARWGWCEKAGDRWWPALANAFMLSCVKKVEKPGLIGKLIPEGGLLKKNWAGQTIATRNQTKNF